jgi:hypothetical protein
VGYLSDSLDFEKFFAKDTWDRIKADPKRLFLGVDPASTWGWNKILGRDDEPIVDQMGGPYDGRVISFGHGNGGVYDRAQAAGINTKSAAGNHDAAHLIAASYALGGGLGSGSGSGSGGGSGSADLFTNMPRTNFSTGMPSTGVNPAAGIPGIAGPVAAPGAGAASAGGGAAGMGAMDYAKLGMGLMKSAQPQEQAPMAQPSFGQRLNAGLGNALFPINPQTSQGLDPSYVSQLQNNALLKLGLGMAAAGREPGATFGAALGAGLGRASGDLNGAMQTAYTNARAARADRRADDREDREMQREDRLDRRQQYLEDHQLEREKVADQRYESDRQYRTEHDDRLLQLRENELNTQSAAADAPRLSPGFAWRDPSNKGLGQVVIPGGPADPNVAANQKTLRPIPASAAQGIIENRTSLKQIDRALAAVDKNPDAFGMQNYMPDVLTQRLPGNQYSGGLEARAQVADIGSLKLHDRSGAAVTAAEFPRLKPFIPLATDDAETVKKKLQNFKANLESIQEEIEGFYTPESGYRPISGNAAPKEDPLGIR